MSSDEAAGERFIASSEFRWMSEVSAILRERLGERANKVPTRAMPNLAVRLASLLTR